MDVDWIARVIALIGLLVAIAGVAVNVVAFRRKTERQKPNIVVRLSRWMLVYGLHCKADYLAFEVQITNLADISNSVLEYGLLIGPPYRDSTGPVEYSETGIGETILIPMPSSVFQPAPLALKGMSLNHLTNPVNLTAHQSRIGWVAFPLPSIPPEIAKGIPFSLWTIPSEGEPVVTPAELTATEFDLVHGVDPQCN